MIGVVLAFLGSSWSWLGFGLPLGLNTVEGSEAALLVGASGARGGWRKSAIAVLAAGITLLPFIAGLYFLFKYFPGAYIDYAIAAVIFSLGLNEIREGLESKPQRKREARPGYARLDGPQGIDPGDVEAIKDFQRAHGLEPDGVVGPRTRGAIRAELAETGGANGANRLGVDVTDRASVRAFQRRFGLQPDGALGPVTRGALAAAASAPILDPADGGAVRAFQQRHGLEPSGVVDDATQAALRTVRVERGRPQTLPHGPLPVDVLDAAAVSRFQHERGLTPTGVVDRATQGALRVELERMRLLAGVDAADPESVRAFQRSQDLTETGIVDAPTQSALAAERDAQEPTSAEARSLLGVDVTDPGSIERFQRLHGLEPSGEVDEETRAELQRAQQWAGGVDPSDPRAVSRFQRRHGLRETGIVDGETQGVMRSVRSGLARRDDRDEEAVEEAPPWLPLDPTDPDSVEDFQREHGLAVDGLLGPQTQAALRALVAERYAAHSRRDGGGIGASLGSYASVWPAYVGTVLESGEAVLYTFGVSHGSGAWVPAAIGGGIGFLLPWAGLVQLRRWVESKPEWLVELSIGLVLVGAASTFGVLRATGIFGA